MARDRIISAVEKPQEAVVDVALRPQRLVDMIGQAGVLEKLKIAMTAATRRGEPLEHVLLEGPPGLGKTTLAHVIAREMTGKAPRITSGPSLTKPSDLMAVLTNLETGDVLFIDECHRMPKIVEEFLYPAMEDFRVDFTIDGGLNGRVVNFALRRFTLIGATTRAGMLSGAMRDRFGHRYHLEFYSVDELTIVLERSAARLSIQVIGGALREIAAKSRGTPRIANRLLKRSRDFAEVRADGVLTESVVADALEVQQIDSKGLDELDRAYLTSIIRIYDGGPAGIESIAASMGQERDTLEDMVEPFLMQIGFLIRTRQGRMATREAYSHLNFTYPEPRSNSTPDQTLFF